MSKPRKHFIALTLWLFVCIKGRINFLQLERFSNFGEQYFRIGFQKEFDFLNFNIRLLEDRLSDCLVIAMDPSYISKSGKFTSGVGTFWSGCAGKAHRGLELCGFAVVDVSSGSAYHLKAFQTPSPAELKARGSDLLSNYGNLVSKHSKEWLNFSQYLVADAYFAKKPFADQVVNAKMHLISRLRDDADLRYLYQGPKSTGRGAPKKYEGKVDAKNPNMEYFILEETTEEYRVYSAVVYSMALKRKIRLALVILLKDGKPNAHKLYFTTDTQLTAITVFQYYRARFKIEFIYRDAKQYTGLEHCQGRSAQKIDFHWNAALTAINLAKIQHQQDENPNKGNFSMANSKTLFHNILLLERFIDLFGINPNTPINQKKVKELLNFGNIAA